MIPHDTVRDRGFWRILLVFLKLGLTSFGGPVAHLGYFRAEFVERRRWLPERDYADLVALCQFLPGPASSQVGMGLGLARGGLPGALAAWLGFTLPSALIMLALAAGLSGQAQAIPPGLLHGLKLAAVAVVAQAVWSMARQLCPDRPRLTLMAAACCLALLIHAPWLPLAVIALAGVAGRCCLPAAAAPPIAADSALPPSRRRGALWLALFFALLAGLPLLAAIVPGRGLAMFDAFYRSGALVFGGGHVVLPLLENAAVASGWVEKDAFLAGYGAAQALPGPLFAFAAFLGAAGGGWLDGALALAAIFLPGFLLLAGALPFWRRLRAAPGAQSALAGVNAAVVGLLLAAFYHLVWTETVRAPADFAAALLALLALAAWRLPPWLVVGLCAAAGWLTR
ncbi:chromate efflux transporter [Chromobacterium violaceum]|uniref:Chromate transporter, chromate ion transporter (CHR) family n=1 Tax=Chromobacterium violaceum TaxID=536 RepID=A0AAX2M4Y4_CHRVL|nr:chromate efflux transporter [Chromobacterium violaceum]STB71563.1 chromate transporter, chromate ion transporter (CHR) family [Chromobacterium violaceum]SUX31455.1 chromate transporter, chromate ion transporter (CHR) family [Chromobacterium violaceum]